MDPLDEAELLGWSVEIVRAARRHGYLASTADAIAVFETSILLAGMRDRANPTPYDFGDAGAATGSAGSATTRCRPWYATSTTGSSR